MSKTYVLETEWTWDETHRELCSFSVEDCELEQNDPAHIFKPVKPREVLNGWLRRFKLIAEAQNGSPLDTCRLKRLWAVDRESEQRRHRFFIQQELTLVGEFNEDGTPKLQLSTETHPQHQ
jgi:hypothetical protein